MPRQFKRLTARTVAAATKPGRHADGDGLYLVVDRSGAKRWLFMFRWGSTPGKPGKLKEMGLGSASSVSLLEAREKAAEARRVLATGANPIEARRVGEARADATFGAFSDELIKKLSHGFRSEKHKEQWRATLRLHASSLRDKRLDEITTEDVLSVLSPIWQTKHESASRLRGRIERVLDAARARGLRTGENPARWRGHLDNLLAGRRRIAQAHYAAMPYPDVPGFVEGLRARQGVAALALEFCILTAARSAEILGARWDEMDLVARTWTVPPHRMKAGREHRVPLSKRAMEILSEMEAIRVGEYVFPGMVPGRPLSVNALKQVLGRSRAQGATVHGFRSSFRDWAGECTAFPREVAEAALAHTVGDETERAYRRGDALEKRRLLMDAWASFLATPNVGGEVVPIGVGKRAG